MVRFLVFRVTPAGKETPVSSFSNPHEGLMFALTLIGNKNELPVEWFYDKIWELKKMDPLIVGTYVSKSSFTTQQVWIKRIDRTKTIINNTPSLHTSDSKAVKTVLREVILEN
jgi:hypothetical protein